MVTLTRGTFWFIKGVMLVAILLLFVSVTYFYGEYCKNKCYLENRREFIAEFKAIKFQLAGESFIYEPRGELILPAKAKGKNLYELRK